MRNAKYLYEKLRHSNKSSRADSQISGKART